MKTNPLVASVVLAAGLLASGASAQTSLQSSAPNSAPAVAVPSSPAPTIDPGARPLPDRVIYAPRLPSAAELTKVAAAQGLAIEQIDQTASQITVVYKFANGQTSTVAYALLPAAGTAPATVATTAAPAVVYYTPPPRVYYYDRSPYFDPFYYPWYGPAAWQVGLGFGFRGHYGGGFDGYHGGDFDERHDGGFGERHGGGFHDRHR